MRRTHHFWLMPFIALLASCGGGGSAPSSSNPPPSSGYTAKSSVAQKGPLIKGSTVNVQELDAKLAPTGKQYSYQTTSDLGTFNPNSSFGSPYLGVAATGYYFDELRDQVSDGTVTLNGYSDLSQDSTVNVNLLTTLAYQRIQKLIANSGLSFAAARTQAEKEVLAALHIPSAAYVAFDGLDVSGNSDGDHILAAVSSLFVYGNASGPMSALIANVQNDIGANGAITVTATRNALAAASIGVNPNAVAADLTQKYASLGVKISASDIADWIDQDGDGVVGKFKFQVPDATPSSLFTFPALVMQQIAGTSVSMTGGQLQVNGSTVSGTVTVKAGDTVAVTPGAGMFPNGVLTVYLLSGSTKTARVSFVSGLTSIAVTPAAASIAKGVTQQFKATGTFSDNHTADLTGSVTWTSNTTSVASIASSGLAQALTVGSTVIKAASGNITASTSLDVSAAVLESVAISPNPAFSGVGLTTQLTATGTYSDATTANVSAMANWSSSVPAVATVGTTGLVSGVSLGGTTISATVGLLTPATVSLSITSGTWNPAAALISVPRCAYRAATLLNGKAMVVGGTDCAFDARTRASAVFYDPLADAWAFGGALATSRQGFTLSVLQDGRALVAGGDNVLDPFLPANYLSSAEIYDPATDSWSSAGSMSQAREGHTATVLSDGRVLIVGGEIGSYTQTAELYDPTTNSWSAAANTTVARSFHSATLLANGTVLIAGGSTNSAELYNPIANTWSSTGSMNVARSVSFLTTLPNGKALVTAGDGVPTAELYDPTAGTWSAAGTLTTGLYVEILTLLPSGKVLASGYPGTAPIAPSSLLYDPAANTWSPTGSMTTDAQTGVLLPGGKVLAISGYGQTALYWQ